MGINKQKRGVEGGAFSERYSWKSGTTWRLGAAFRRDPPGRSSAISEVLRQRSPPSTIRF